MVVVLGVLIRGLQNLESPCKGERIYSFRLYEKNQKYPKGLRPSGLPGTIQSSVGEDFSKNFRRHEPNPVFRTKRRRKGFESVRRSGVTARGFRAEIKRTALFFADSRLWLGANLRCLWWKRVVWDGNKERLVQTESVWFAKKCCF